MTEDSPRYEGWRVVAASGVGVFSVSLFVFTFGVLLRPLTEAFSWSREAVSSAFGSMTLAVAFSAPLFGYLVDRHGPRWIVGPSLTVAACAFASLSALTSQLWHLYAVFVVIGLASAGTSPVVYSRVVSGWFERRRGVALALVISSIGVGGVVHPAIGQILINVVGWRATCLILGAVILVVGVPTIIRFVREPGSEMSHTHTSAKGISVSEALGSRIFWTLLVVVFGSTLAMNAIVVHLSALLTDRDVSASQAAIAMSAMGGASLIGRLLTGWLLDRFDATRVSFVLLTIAAIGTLLLARGSSLTTGVLAAALIGFGQGGEVDVTPYLLSRYFGLRSLSTLYGVIWAAFGLAGAAGPLLMGRAFDSTGSYEVALISLAFGTLVVAVLMLTLPAYRSQQVDVLSSASG